MEINRQNLQLAFTGFKAVFQNAFAGAEPDYTQFTMEVPSTTAKETYGWLGSTTQFREWIGDRVIQNLSLHDYTITNKTFENTVGIGREAFEDDTYGLFSPMISQLGQDTAEHPGLLVHDLLSRGFSEKCYDGQNFFDTDHPVLDKAGKETSVSNFQGGSGTAWYLLDITRAVKPMILQKRRAHQFVSKTSLTDDNVFNSNEFVYGVDGRLNAGFGLWQLAYSSKETLDATSFNAAYAAMQSMQGDRGKKLGIRPKLLMVPPTLRATALEVVKAERNAAGATNINRDVVDVLVTPWQD